MCKHVAGKIVKQYYSIQSHLSVSISGTNALHFIYKHVLNFTLDTPMSLDLHPQNT